MLHHCELKAAHSILTKNGVRTLKRCKDADLKLISVS
jgi:hypothetical protein